MRPTQIRGIMNGIVNRPNLIREKQMRYQNDPSPTYLKGNGKIYFRSFLVLFTFSFLGSNYQMIQYIRGKAKKVGE